MRNYATIGAVFAGMLGLGLLLYPERGVAQQPSASAVATATELATLKGA